MGHNQTNLLLGTLDLLLLKAIGDGEFHGLRVSRRIEPMTQGTFQAKPGPLFPALRRMEEAGWKAGARQLDIETKEWETIARVIENPLKAT